MKKSQGQTFRHCFGALFEDQRPPLNLGQVVLDGGHRQVGQLPLPLVNEVRILDQGVQPLLGPVKQEKSLALTPNTQSDGAARNFNKEIQNKPFYFGRFRSIYLAPKQKREKPLDLTT